ncbi:GNAT family N-acetyltransferase [Pseudoalteromonas rubra]|uniref:GNAT family N-acetyltransferase n=1 Tax=Pseudoalteromonas rubra TaxID=43658 RepID=UPI002DC04AE2|nr:GNAT family N-acetyltransferase [Pseudoalteromonas rubra]MEC4088829.1 GNAT family N-acetyltransferase [Pseudoalteromonas rubra]
MHIRPAEPGDLDTLSQICLEAFNTALAATLSSEGCDTFRAVAAPVALATRLAEGNQILVAEIAEQTVGMIELKAGRHIAMLFISPSAQRKGVGKALVATALKLAKEPKVTVSASLPSVAAYHSYGFTLAGEIAESGGLIYQPMEVRLAEAH